MLQTIWKFGLPAEAVLTKVEMPSSAEILCVQAQRGFPMIWVTVDCDFNHKVERSFLAVETGEEFRRANNCKYLGTVQCRDGGTYTLHIFEIVP
jgi:hypothetical protein